MKHVFQQKIKTVFISSRVEEILDIKKLESEKSDSFVLSQIVKRFSLLGAF